MRRSSRRCLVAHRPSALLVALTASGIQRSASADHRRPGSGVGARRQAHRGVVPRSHLDDDAGRPAGQRATHGRSRTASSASRRGRPTASRIAFAASRGDGFDIYIASLKGGPATAVTSMPGDERWPSWTPDGRLVFAHRDDEPAGRAADPGLQWDLFIVAPVAGSPLAGAGAV